MKTYCVWTKDYYESGCQYYPRPDQVLGRFQAADVKDLKRQIVETGLDPKNYRWEAVAPKEQVTS